MRIFDPTQFAESWLEGKIAWQSYLVQNTPVVFNCPHCKQPIIEAQLKEEKREQACLVFGNCVFVVPNDIPTDLLESILDLFKQSILEERKVEETET